jgi:hypothetical protein
MLEPPMAVRPRYCNWPNYPNHPSPIRQVLWPIGQFLNAGCTNTKFPQAFSAILPSNNSMRRILIGCLCSVLTVHAAAQMVTGIVQDSITHAPVKFVTIGIRRPESDSVSRETITDDKGRFVFGKLQQGTFEVTLSFVGYSPKKLPIVITADSKTINLGIIFPGAPRRNAQRGHRR